MTDEQITQLTAATNDGIFMLGTWLNSESLWTLVGVYLGFFISACLIAYIIRKIFASFGFFARD